MENSLNLPGGSSSQRPPFRSAETMFPLVEEQQSGGLTQKQFCALHGVPLHVFSYWLRKYRDSRPEAGGFVQLVAPTTGPGCAVRLVLGDGRSLEFGGLVPVKYLSELMRETG